MQRDMQRRQTNPAVKTGKAEGGLLSEAEDGMVFRRRLHRHWRERSKTNDSSGLKSAMVEWSNLWLVSTALAMTVAFAMLIEGPRLPSSSAAIDEKIAVYLYLGFTLRATYMSLFLISSCAMWVQTTTSIPASDYSRFLRACGLKEKPWLADPGDYVYMLYGQLLLAATALCYIYYGVIGAVMSLFALFRFVSLCADNISAWQRCLKSFEGDLGAKPGTYISSWGGYGEGCRGMLAAFWNTVIGPSYPCLLGAQAGQSRALPRANSGVKSMA